MFSVEHLKERRRLLEIDPPPMITTSELRELIDSHIEALDVVRLATEKTLAAEEKAQQISKELDYLARRVLADQEFHCNKSDELVTETERLGLYPHQSPVNEYQAIIEEAKVLKSRSGWASEGLADLIIRLTTLVGGHQHVYIWPHETAAHRTTKPLG
jgi:hypothetical protein